MTKGPLSTPFHCGYPAPSPKGKGDNGVYDHHTTPILNKPRDVGKDAPKEIFFTDVKGSPTTKLDSPMQKTLAQGTFAIDKMGHK